MNTKPETAEILAAWKEFKATKLFPVLIAHLERADKVLASEGTIWGLYSNGYIAGYEASPDIRAMQEAFEQVCEALEDVVNDKTHMGNIREALNAAAPYRKGGV